MVNTLGNAPEKITSTPRGSSSSALKKIVAAAIALTLSGQPAEAKTYNKQEFPTEMVANVPGTISPMTENVEQTSVPNYIDQAQEAVKKYYPQYEEYFKGQIKEIKLLGEYEQYLFNKESNRNIINAGSLLKNEKEIITTVLISIEKVNGKEYFKKGIGISEDSNINDISNDIINGFFRKHEKTQKNLENFEHEITKGVNSIGEEFITISEKYMASLKDFFIDFGFIKESKEAQDWIKTYINALQKIGKKPSQIGQKYIDEYNKIKN